MLISCLLPTYNRYPAHSELVDEAVQSFLLQDYQNKELIILNDTPGQTICIQHPQIKVVNRSERFDTLGNKIHYMIQSLAQGQYICRWDDDDISLPWRLNLSMGKLMRPDSHSTITDPATGFAHEWRPENHWFYPKDKIEKVSEHPGNTHIMAIWHRDILGTIDLLVPSLNPIEYTISPKVETQPIVYPGEPCPSGLEDQTFTSQLRKRGYPYTGELLPLSEIFYLYRWGVQPNHLSGKGGGETMQRTYEQIGREKVFKQTYTIRPRWLRNYAALAADAAQRLAATQLPVGT